MIGLVEAAALEADTDAAEYFAERSGANRALGQRVVGECLHGLESVAALPAAIFVGGHGGAASGSCLRTNRRVVAGARPALALA